MPCHSLPPMLDLQFEDKDEFAFLGILLSNLSVSAIDSIETEQHLMTLN